LVELFTREKHFKTFNGCNSLLLKIAAGLLVIEGWKYGAAENRVNGGAAVVCPLREENQLPLLLRLRRLRLLLAFLWELGRPKAIKAYSVPSATLQNLSMKGFDSATIQKLADALRAGLRPFRGVGCVGVAGHCRLPLCLAFARLQGQFKPGGSKLPEVMNARPLLLVAGGRLCRFWNHNPAPIVGQTLYRPLDR